MNKEIERKFLVNGEPWKGHQAYDIQQGYLSEGEVTTRVRISNKKSYLTLKGKKTGITCSEYEYEIPLHDAQQMINSFCGKQLIQKKRYNIYHDGFRWEVDVFEGSNEGLVIAELELSSEDQQFTFPDWIGEEMSSDARYYNSCLLERPWPFDD